MRPISAFTAVATAQSTAASPATAIQRSPWHSPVPYLFGGLAAMLGLIAFALLILACSYWRLTAREEDRRESQREDAEKDDSPDSAGKSPAVYEEKILVIMAGNERPTFLATPACSKLVIAVKGSEERREKEVEERESSDEKLKEELTIIVVDHDHHSDGENSHDEESQRRSQ